MRIAPLTVGLTLALSLTACTQPITLAQAPKEEKADETMQLVDGTETESAPTADNTAANETDASGTEATANGTDDTSEAGNSVKTDVETSVESPEAKERVFATGTSEESASLADVIADITASGSLLATSTEWPQCEATVGAPIPAFNAPITYASMNEDGYSSGANATWQDVPEADVISYLKALRDAGFVYETSLSRASDSFSYSASDTGGDSYAGPHRTVNLSYHRPYDEEESTHGFVLEISVWLNRDDAGMEVYPRDTYTEDVIID